MLSGIPYLQRGYWNDHQNGCYLRREIGLGANAMIGSILLVQFIGIPCTILFGGLLAGRLRTKPSIFIGLAIYLGIAFLGICHMQRGSIPDACILVGMVQGGHSGFKPVFVRQSHSKAQISTVFRLVCPERKIGGLGPALFVLMITLTGSSRYAIVSVILFFVVGGSLLSRVDVDEGRQLVQCEGASTPRRICSSPGVTMT